MFDLHLQRFILYKVEFPKTEKDLEIPKLCCYKSLSLSDLLLSISAIAKSNLILPNVINFSTKCVCFCNVEKFLCLGKSSDETEAILT